MTEFRTTATHDGRAVPMPGINLATCDEEDLAFVVAKYDLRNGDLADRIRADARASAAPSEDAIRVREREAFRQGVITERAGVAWANERDRLYPAPRPVYAAPVRLSDGGTFGQVGPDMFVYVSTVENATYTRNADTFRKSRFFTPADGALVLAVLDGDAMSERRWQDARYFHAKYYDTATGEVLGSVARAIGGDYYATARTQSLGEFIDEAKARAAVERKIAVWDAERAK